DARPRRGARGRAVAGLRRRWGGGVGVPAPGAGRAVRRGARAAVRGSGHHGVGALRRGRPVRDLRRGLPAVVDAGGGGRGAPGQRRGAGRRAVDGRLHPGPRAGAAHPPRRAAARRRGGAGAAGAVHGDRRGRRRRCQRRRRRARRRARPPGGLHRL
ncbi:MAG: hypothetical protein AVDCRST_MAG35-146, partial [uncultured Quadrisphaera sp.]